MAERANKVYDSQFFDDQKRVKRLPSSVFLREPYAQIKCWLHTRARYILATDELLTFLEDQIGGKTAIEIGSGMGDVGYHLGIPMTDSYIQQTPAMKAHYKKFGPMSVPTSPPHDVEKLCARSAVASYRPQVVIGCWVAELYKQHIHGGDPKAFASIHGVDESEMLDHSGIETYIHVGHKDTHYKKTILTRPHVEIQLPGHLSRNMLHKKNVIWIWNVGNDGGKRH